MEIRTPNKERIPTREKLIREKVGIFLCRFLRLFVGKNSKLESLVRGGKGVKIFVLIAAFFGGFRFDFVDGQSSSLYFSWVYAV
jgi:hypothetical protein